MKLSLTILVSIGLIFYSFINENVEGKSMQDNDLLEMIAVAKNEDIELTSWSIYNRTIIGKAASVQEVETVVTEKMEQESAFDWRLLKKEEGHHYIWEGTNDDTEDTQVTEKITAYKVGSTYTITVTVEIKGTDFAEEILTHYTKFAAGETYYTIRGSVEAKEQSIATSGKKLVKAFDGETIEIVNEDNFQSLSVYSKQMDTSILTKDNKEMNLQIGLRTNSDPAVNKIDITIGTPIITTEY